MEIKQALEALYSTEEERRDIDTLCSRLQGNVGREEFVQAAEGLGNLARPLLRMQQRMRMTIGGTDFWLGAAMDRSKARDPLFHVFRWRELLVR